APMFVPAAKDYVNYIVFSNSVVSIFSSELIYPNTKPYQKSVILARFSNFSTANVTRSGTLTNSHGLVREFGLQQAYMDFVYNPNVLEKGDSTITYIGPDASPESQQFLWENKVYFNVRSSLPEPNRTFIKASDLQWLKVTSKEDTLKFSNSSFILPVSNIEVREQELLRFEFDYRFIKSTGTDTVDLKFDLTEKSFLPEIKQLPEWKLSSNPAFTVLGGQVVDYRKITGEGEFVNWAKYLPTPDSTSEVNGKKNTLEAVNRLIQGGGYSNMNEKVKNAFLFCASLNKTAKMKISNSQMLSLGDLDWYVPSINQTKLMMIFENNALAINRNKSYFSSTFKGGNLIYLAPDTYSYFLTLHTSENPMQVLMRCVRDTKPNLSDAELLSSVKIEPTESGYIVNSSTFYSSSIKSVPNLPTNTEMAQKFEIYNEEPGSVSFVGAINYCSSIPSTSGNWRLPTQKEIVLMSIYQDEFKSKPNFTPIAKKSYFSSNSLLISTNFIFVMDFLTGGVESHSKEDFKANVRCVKSVQ
ncbi:MAG: hypothetical protein ACRC9Q_01860, partial [Bacteroidales bacterium]